MWLLECSYFKGIVYWRLNPVTFADSSMQMSVLLPPGGDLEVAHIPLQSLPDVERGLLETSPLSVPCGTSHLSIHSHALHHTCKYILVYVVLQSLMDKHPKKLRKYKTEEERTHAFAERKKLYDKARIYIGYSIHDWDKLKQVCGGSHAEFAKHLLSLHRAYCSKFSRISSCLERAVSQHLVYNFKMFAGEYSTFPVIT